MDKENIKAAIAAFASGGPCDIVDAVSVLTDDEKTCVKIIQELTAPPAKRKRSDAGKLRKAVQG